MPFLAQLSSPGPLGGRDVEIFQPLDQVMLADPYPIYADLRRRDPVHWHEQFNVHLLTRYSDCDRVFSDPQTFSADVRAFDDEVPDEILSIQMLDPPDHGVVRRMVLAALKGVDLQAWLADVSAMAEKLFSTVGEGEFDFITEFAEPLAARSMWTLFGVPLFEDEETVRTMQRDIILSMDSWVVPECGPAGIRARAYLSELIEPWTVRPPVTGLLSQLDFDAAGQHRQRLVNSMRAIFVAGFSTSSSMLGNAVRALVEHGCFDTEEPPAVTTTMAHELVRYVGTVQADFRTVLQDVQLGECRLRPADVVVLMLGAANRDPEIFEAPDQLRLDRNPNPHLGFGKGIHSCVGARFAVRMMLDVLGSLAEKYRIEISGDPVQRPTATHRGLCRLPLRLRLR
ncbi:MAG: cytochrome P450 [Pseudonocardiaceae bacterium]